jgi:hypothetical protein
VHVAFFNRSFYPDTTELLLVGRRRRPPARPAGSRRRTGGASAETKGDLFGAVRLFESTWIEPVDGQAGVGRGPRSGRPTQPALVSGRWKPLGRKP